MINMHFSHFTIWKHIFKEKKNGVEIIINFSLEFTIKNLLFTFLTNDCEAKFKQIVAFSESVRISHGQHLPQRFFQYLLLLYSRDLNMSRLTCNAILRLVYADFTWSERLSVSRSLLGI